MLVGLISSAGTIEVAVNQGSAAERLRAGVGTAVRVGMRRKESPGEQVSG